MCQSQIPFDLPHILPKLLITGKTIAKQILVQDLQIQSEALSKKNSTGQSACHTATQWQLIY